MTEQEICRAMAEYGLSIRTDYGSAGQPSQMRVLKDGKTLGNPGHSGLAVRVHNLPENTKGWLVNWRDHKDTEAEAMDALIEWAINYISIGYTV
jgi:hypothetical protein